MALNPEELRLLEGYFPKNAFDMVVKSFEERRFKLEFCRPRRTKLGDFRPPKDRSSICRITLNGNLNPYLMLITYIHELAHYQVYVKYGSRTAPHGKEWKEQFQMLMQPYLSDAVFPEDILIELRRHMDKVAATSSADIGLMKVLKTYEDRRSGLKTVDEIADGQCFVTSNGLLFRKGVRLRKRYKCFCETNKRWYFVNPLLEVKPVEP